MNFLSDLLKKHFKFLRQLIRLTFLEFGRVKLILFIVVKSSIRDVNGGNRDFGSTDYLSQ